MAGVHLVKLSVGSDSVEQVRDWQQNRSKQRRDGRYYHLTRMFPRRADELLDGGSIYWVIGGAVLARQPIAAIEEMRGTDGIRRCALFLSPQLVRVAPAPKRPFQGWRYLEAADAPPDLSMVREGDDDLPPTLAAALSEIGVR